jgi:hypothetical protein
MTSSHDSVRGSTEPRIWTRPLRELTPETSYGFGVIAFAADVLGTPLDPWEEWLVIHAGELLADGRPRFRQVLVIVARQNGKTFLLGVLALYWLFVTRVALVLGTSTNLDYAREAWEKAVQMAEDCEVLAEEIPKNGVRRANGEQTLTTVARCRYKIAASNRKGGRSLTIWRLILDELREHDSWDAWNASVPATNAVRDAQVFAITNMGDRKAVVLKALRKSAVTFIKTGKGDSRLAMFEWSAPKGSDPTDVTALGQANPNLGYRIEVDSLLGAAARAKENGGEELTGFLTEMMCISVDQMDPAIDRAKWAECLNVGDLSEARSRVALCLDVSMDQQHATLVAAAVMPDGRVRVEVVAAWSGPTCISDLRRELPGIVAKVKPRKFGWFPSGPAAAVAAALAAAKVSWPAGVSVEELRAEVTAICMGLAEQVDAEDILHSGDPLLDAHIEGAEKLMQGEAWRFTRKGAGHCDGAYGTAGAVHLARTMPVPAKAIVLRGRRPAPQ